MTDFYRFIGDNFQDVAYSLCIHVFGEENASSIRIRGLRFLEEAIELAQVNDVERADAHKLVDYIFDRPQGDCSREIGGVMMTLCALASLRGRSVLSCLGMEIERIHKKHEADPEHFRKRNKVKEDAGFSALRVGMSFQPIGSRRHKADPGECKFCDEERAKNSDFHPPHDASDRCESGKHNHCTCDTCF